MFLIILRAFRTCSTPRLHELFDAAELTFTTVLNRRVLNPSEKIKHSSEPFTPVLNQIVLKSLRFHVCNDVLLQPSRIEQFQNQLSH